MHNASVCVCMVAACMYVHTVDVSLPFNALCSCEIQVALIVLASYMHLIIICIVHRKPCNITGQKDSCPQSEHYPDYLPHCSPLPLCLTVDFTFKKIGISTPPTLILPNVEFCSPCESLKLDIHSHRE